MFSGDIAHLSANIMQDLLLLSIARAATVHADSGDYTILCVFGRLLQKSNTAWENPGLRSQRPDAINQLQGDEIPETRPSRECRVCLRDSR